MGGAWQRLRMSLLGWSDDIAGHAFGCPEPRIQREVAAIESRKTSDPFVEVVIPRLP
jgi:hypothetical protein